MRKLIFATIRSELFKDPSPFESDNLTVLEKINLPGFCEIFYKVYILFFCVSITTV